MKANLEPSGLPAYFGGLVALIDGTIHQQDIRARSASPAPSRPDRLRPTLQYALWARRGVVGDLSGPGQPRLAKRIKR